MDESNTNLPHTSGLGALILLEEAPQGKLLTIVKPISQLRKTLFTTIWVRESDLPQDQLRRHCCFSRGKEKTVTKNTDVNSPQIYTVLLILRGEVLPLCQKSPTAFEFLNFSLGVRRV